MLGLARRSAQQQVTMIQDGVVPALAAAESSRDEITRYEGRLKAWVEFDDLAEQAATLEHTRLPLAGLSIGVKDIIDVGGMPTRCGSDTTSHLPAERDADCVARLRSLGAMVQGKTVTTEYGYFSPGPTTNPYCVQATPGGSSSGSAAAVGAGLVSLALGTQTAGSLTRPASFCGAAGLVFTHGSTSLAGISGLSESLDSLGFLSPTVADLAFCYEAFTRSNASPGAASGRSLKDARIHVWEGSSLLNLDPAMSELLEETVSMVTDYGAQVSTLDWDDHIRTLVDDHRTVMSYEAARGLGRTLGPDRRRISSQLQELFDSGDSVTEDQWREALFRRDISLEHIYRALEEGAVILGPAAKGAAPLAENGTGSPDLSRPWQMLGLPVVTVPGARTRTGMPLGIQLIGDKGTEQNLLELGRLLEPLLRELPSFDDNPTPSTLREMKW
jgi:Asp-tRNA(Asn)/Glu-tRNA(Gln) amidotransferase A subunit family amidase